MDSGSFTFLHSAEQLVDKKAQLTSAGRVIEFYEEAGLDYEHWSKGLNMHLGLYRWGTNPFNREQMFERLNLEVADRLQLDSETCGVLSELSCGMWAITR